MPLEKELRILGPRRNKDILEVACGGGQSAVQLARKGSRVVGVDFSAKQLEFARELAKAQGVAVRFLEANAENLSIFDDESFDIAFSAYAFGFVENTDPAFLEAWHVLRRGWLFALSWASPLYGMTEEGGLKITRSYFDRTPSVDQDEYEMEVNFARTHGDWHRDLTAAGFVVTDIVEPEPVAARKGHKPFLGTYGDAFPMAKIRTIPGTTIWRAPKPRRVES